MKDDNLPAPLRYQGVMVSSTFTDLKEHRSALVKAIKGAGFTNVAMENDTAKPIDVIESSLGMVRDCSAYVGVISRKYGQTPKCPKRNPGKASVTELEFNEALRLNRPILLFIMGEKHPVLEAGVETNAAKRKKLKAFSGSQSATPSRQRNTLLKPTRRHGPMASPTSGATNSTRPAPCWNTSAEVPKLPPYDPAKDEKLPWEDEVAAAIEKLRAEKEAKNAAKTIEEV